MEIINRIKRNWDWFESTRWLNILTGFLAASSLALIFLLIFNGINYNLQQKIGITIMIIGMQGTQTLTSKMVNIIRDKNK